MRIHSDIIGPHDIEAAVIASRTVLLQSDVMCSRKRKFAREITLGGLSRSRTQRFRDERAATYRQWGTFLAHLFYVDADMIAGNYRGRDDFDAQTRYAFDAVPYTTDGDKRVAVIFRDTVKG